MATCHSWLSTPPKRKQPSCLTEQFAGTSPVHLLRWGEPGLTQKGCCCKMKSFLKALSHPPLPRSALLYSRVWKPFLRPAWPCFWREPWVNGARPLALSQQSELPAWWVAVGQRCCSSQTFLCWGRPLFFCFNSFLLFETAGCPLPRYSSSFLLP